MKINLKKLNEYIKHTTDQEIKNFVLNTLKFHCGFNINNEPDYSYYDDADNVLNIKIQLFDLGFCEPENSDKNEYIKDFNVINFNLIQSLNIELKNIIITQLYNSYTENLTNFAISIFEDFNIYIPYENYNKISRKQKLEKLKTF